MVDEVSRYEELRSHFVDLASKELEQVESDLDDDDLAKPQRKALLKLRAALQYEDEGWRDWVILSGTKGVPPLSRCNRRMVWRAGQLDLN